MFYVYVLYSEKYDRYYIGQTDNRQNRLIRHNKGYVKSTKAYRPWALVYSETYNSRIESVNRESQLKSWKSKVKIAELVNASR